MLELVTPVVSLPVLKYFVEALGKLDQKQDSSLSDHTRAWKSEKKVPGRDSVDA